MPDEQTPVVAAAVVVPAVEAEAPAEQQPQETSGVVPEKKADEQPAAEAPAQDGNEQEMNSTTTPSTATAAAAVETPAEAADAAEAAPATGAQTPEVDEDINSRKVTLADLCSHAAALFAQKDYNGASDLYARAAELQAELRGDLDPENAEILFLYGRCLFKVGQANSKVLGGGPDAGDDDEKTKKVQEALGGKPSQEGEGSGKKGLVQFEGDDLMEEDGNEEDGEEEAGEEEEEDDGEKGEEGADENTEMHDAFETLDLASVLFKKQLETIDEKTPEKQPEKKPSAEPEAEAKDEDDENLALRHIKERLGDVHDLLAEISLEDERFLNAAEDSRVAIKYKSEIYPPESGIIAEARYKLSLALEFASINRGEDAEKKPVDEDLRAEAAAELEAVVNSTKLRLQAKEVDLATSASPEDNDLIRSEIADLKDVLADMEHRLAELRKPPVDLTTALTGAGVSPLGGLLGQALGMSSAQATAMIEEARRGATDLTGLVRKKNTSDAPAAAAAAAPVPAAAPEATSATNGGSNKRKAEEDDDADAEGAGSGSEAKKARVEDA